MATAEKVVKLGLVKEAGWLYYISRDGWVMRVSLYSSGNGERVAKIDVEVVPDDGVRRWLYFVDKEGDVARTSVSYSGGAEKRKKDGVVDCEAETDEVCEN